jgi:hypothetical protein
MVSQSRESSECHPSLKDTNLFDRISKVSGVWAPHCNHLCTLSWICQAYIVKESFYFSSQTYWDKVQEDQGVWKWGTGSSVSDTKGRQTTLASSIPRHSSHGDISDMIAIVSPYQPRTCAPMGVALDQMRTSLVFGNELHIPCGDQSYTLFMISVAHHTFTQPNKSSLEGIPASSSIITKSKEQDSGVLAGT